MYELLARVFGKSLGFGAADVVALAAGAVPGDRQESGWLEYKGPRDDHWEESGVRRDIVEACVAFLNKRDGEGGLLILGVEAASGIPTGARPIPTRRLTKGMIVSWIGEHVRRLPSNTPRPEFEVIEIPAEGDSAYYLVEVHPHDAWGVFYSGLTQQGFLRRSDRSDVMPLSEFEEMLRSKSCPRVFVDFQLSKPVGGSMLLTELTLLLVNEGRQPGTRLVCHLNLKPPTGVIARAVGIGNTKFLERPVASGGAQKHYQFNAGGSLEIPIYPASLTEVGILSVESPSDWTLEVEVRIQELNGATTQRLTLSRVGSDIRKAEIVRDFAPF